MQIEIIGTAKACRLRLRKGLCLIMLLLCAFPLGAYGETVRGDLQERYADVLRLQHEGVDYRMRSRITTVLLAGIDRRADDPYPEDEYRNAGQADFQMVLAIDDQTDTVHAIQINRDTMTRISVMNVLGEISGTRNAQICLAHSFGDGKEQSCELLVDAVSAYLMDVPIDYYAAMNMDGISVINDAMGGVELTLKDDFTDLDPEMAAGKTMVLNGKQAEYYVRSRIGIGDQTNLSRADRQKQYISAAANKLSGSTRTASRLINEIVDAAEHYLVTDMSRGRMVNLADRIRDYELLIYDIEGTAVVGKYDVMEFYTDQDDLMRVILEVFFEAES